MKPFMPILTAALLAISLRAAACVPPMPDRFFGEDGFILVGTATGSTWQSRSSVYLVTFKVTEVLRGKAPQVLSAESPCGFPIQNGERVLVGMSFGKPVVYPAFPAAEQEVRDSLHHER